MDMERKETDKMTVEEARKQQGMSRREVSEWLEIPYRTLTNWENGVRSCPHYIEKLIVEKNIAGANNEKAHREPQDNNACGLFYERGREHGKSKG
mgnify:CR=1 FL=1